MLVGSLEWRNHKFELVHVWRKMACIMAKMVDELLGRTIELVNAFKEFSLMYGNGRKRRHK